MIEDFVIFSRSGIVLFRAGDEESGVDDNVDSSGVVVDSLIKDFLLLERQGETAIHNVNDNGIVKNIRCKIRNDLEIIFAAIYTGVLQLTYLESILEKICSAFLTRMFRGDKNAHKNAPIDKEFNDMSNKELLDCYVKNASSQCSTTNRLNSFSSTYRSIKAECDRNELSNRRGEMKKFSQTEKGRKAGRKEELKEDSDDYSNKKKKSDYYRGPKDKISKKDIDRLDYSTVLGDSTGGDEISDDIEKMRAEFLGLGEEDGIDDMDAKIELKNFSSDEENLRISSSKKNEGIKKNEGMFGKLYSSIQSKIQNYTGGKILEKEDIEPILLELRNQLTNKNVAKEVADNLIDSVRISLIGFKTETTLHRTIQLTLVQAIKQLLEPKKSIDVLRSALSAKSQKKVFSIVFLGVNGVGKSTNLAKVAYYLKQKAGLSVLIAACDTFRAGAVEQLKVHSRCLDVELFQRGYGKDPAEIARTAIKYAEEKKIDVVLVDTAGRMQGNEPLMREIAKLVSVNNPDLVLFVAEALTGNDAIDQVKKFERSLIDMSPDRIRPRGIDGLLLTKYDTVDDKVGAALSMVYTSGQPVVFVGTGQKYPNLKKLQPEEICNQLLS